MLKHIKKLLTFLILGMAISLFSNHPAQAQWDFIRGDKDGDGDVDVDDYYLFSYEDPGPCLDANDVDDNGLLEPADVNYLVDYLYYGGPPPPPPFPSCGPDPTPDPLSCGFTSCAMKTFVRGDADCDGLINSQDSTFLVNFLVGGPAPACLDAADVNDDGAISNADVGYLYNYLNFGGPPPPPPFPSHCIDPTFDTLTCDSSCSPTPECADGIDNDGDGLIDFGPDCGCTNPCDTLEVNNHTQCSDGVDNDGDGFIDLADCGCTDSCDFTESPQDQCRDGIDNDGDGKIDLADSNCVDSCDFSEFVGCTHKPGDLNGNGAINLTDIVGLVMHVFKGAPAPVPKCRGDANGDGKITLTDIIYVANFVFKNGVDPIPSGVCCNPT